MFERYKVLLRDYGYKVEGNLLIEKGIRGFTSDRIVRRVRHAMDAAEYLAPIVADSEYTDRLIRLQEPRD